MTAVQLRIAGCVRNSSAKTCQAISQEPLCKEGALHAPRHDDLDPQYSPRHGPQHRMQQRQVALQGPMHATGMQFPQETPLEKIFRVLGWMQLFMEG